LKVSQCLNCGIELALAEIYDESGTEDFCSKKCNEIYEEKNNGLE